MPYALIEDSRLDANARWLYVCLRRRADYADDTCYPGVPDLVQLSGLGKTTVLTSLKVLVAAGWIARTRRGQMQTNVYTVLKSATQTSVMEGTEGRSLPDGPLKSARRTLEVRHTDPNDNHLTKITEREPEEGHAQRSQRNHHGGAGDDARGERRQCAVASDAPGNQRHHGGADGGGSRTPRPSSDPGGGDGAAVGPVALVFAHYRKRVQPQARLIDAARTKIAARLKSFSADELKAGIDHFADDHWYMDNNAHRGAAWFFKSDERAEQFLHMKPRARPAERNGHAKPAAPGKLLQTFSRKQAGSQPYLQTVRCPCGLVYSGLLPACRCGEANPQLVGAH